MCRSGKPKGSGSGRNRGGRYGKASSGTKAVAPKKGVLKKHKSKLYIVDQETPDE
jgi:hypothetical protein